MNTAYLSLGSNEGDRRLWMEKAIDAINVSAGTVTMRSALYETAAWGITDQPNFLNMVIFVETQLAATDLLKTILDIELQLGRLREVKWGPRIIDLDILLYNHEVIDIPGLSIPHPFLHLRRFTLIPLVQLAPNYIHPILLKISFPILNLRADRI